MDVWNDLVVRNCTTVVGTTHHFAGFMRQRGHGGIVLVTSGAAWAGGSHLAVYGASKAFDLVLAESLWAELSPAGVDVLGMVLGPTDTPAFRKVLNGRQLDGIADPDDVARDMLDNLANGPTFPPDPTPFSAIPRRQAVELMSQGSSVPSTAGLSREAVSSRIEGLQPRCRRQLHDVMAVAALIDPPAARSTRPTVRVAPSDRDVMRRHCGCTP